MPSRIVNAATSSRGSISHAGSVRFPVHNISNVTRHQSSGVLERKLTDLVTKHLMAAHLSLDLKQVEEPEVGQLYQQVSSLKTMS